MISVNCRENRVNSLNERRTNQEKCQEFDKDQKERSFQRQKYFLATQKDNSNGESELSFSKSPQKCISLIKRFSQYKSEDDNPHFKLLHNTIKEIGAKNSNFLQKNNYSKSSVKQNTDFQNPKMSNQPIRTINLNLQLLKDGTLSNPNYKERSLSQGKSARTNHKTESAILEESKISKSYISYFKNIDISNEKNNRNISQNSTQKDGFLKIKDQDQELRRENKLSRSHENSDKKNKKSLSKNVQKMDIDCRSPRLKAKLEGNYKGSKTDRINSLENNSSLLKQDLHYQGEIMSQQLNKNKICLSTSIQPHNSGQNSVLSRVSTSPNPIAVTSLNKIKQQKSSKNSYVKNFSQNSLGESPHEKKTQEAIMFSKLSSRSVASSQTTDSLSLVIAVSQFSLIEDKERSSFQLSQNRSPSEKQSSLTKLSSNISRKNTKESINQQIPPFFFESKKPSSHENGKLQYSNLQRGGGEVKERQFNRSNYSDTDPPKFSKTVHLNSNLTVAGERAVTLSEQYSQNKEKSEEEKLNASKNRSTSRSNIPLPVQKHYVPSIKVNKQMENQQKQIERVNISAFMPSKNSTFNFQTSYFIPMDENALNGYIDQQMNKSSTSFPNVQNSCRLSSIMNLNHSSKVNDSQTFEKLMQKDQSSVNNFSTFQQLESEIQNEPIQKRNNSKNLIKQLKDQF